jgi:hypothetical protein
MSGGSAGLSTRGKVVIGGLVLAAVLLVGLSVQRPELPEFPPSPILADDAPADARDPSEPRLLTIDATDPERWRHVDLTRGTVVEEPAPDAWDLAFRRFEVRVNGGAGSAAAGGVVLLEELSLDSVRGVPGEGYVGMTARGRDTTHTVLDGWYSYSFTTHVLRPEPRTYAVRTAAGRHAALEFVSYYCPGAQPGCVTLRYRFLEPSGS